MITSMNSQNRQVLHVAVLLALVTLCARPGTTLISQTASATNHMTPCQPLCSFDAAP